MIEVNLLPGGKKGRSRSFKFKLPGLPTGGMPDRYILWCVAAGIIALGYMGYAYFGARGESENLGVQLTEGLQDSTRFSDQIARANELIARGDSIAQRVAIIQEIDVDRYTWPHLLHEVPRAPFRSTHGSERSCTPARTRWRSASTVARAAFRQSRPIWRIWRRLRSCVE